ncbi:MAG: hypothetical protein QMD71_09700 [bacterium]|nr:hypothetical protein [bacterium]
MKIKVLEEPSSKQLKGKLYGEIGIGTYNRQWVALNSATLNEREFYETYKKEGSVYIYIYTKGGTLWKATSIEVIGEGSNEWVQIWLSQAETTI